MSELIQEFAGQSIDEWEKWYLEKYPDAIQKASEKIQSMIDNLKEVIDEIDREMVENWVYDLVIIKTFIGLRFQEAILSKVAELKNTNYRLATPEEEARGVDGYIGNEPVSIKPETYKIKADLQEKIKARFIFYKKVKDGISIDLSEMS